MNRDSAVFIRAIKGPIIMITIGALFALDNFTVLSFHRTWPILVIVIGVLSLAGKTARPDVPYVGQWPPTPPPATPYTAPPPPPPNPVSTAQPGSYRGSSYQAAPAPAPGDAGTHEGGPTA